MQCRIFTALHHITQALRFCLQWKQTRESKVGHVAFVERNVQSLHQYRNFMGIIHYVYL